MGFSAGGHLYASYGVFWNTEKFVNQLSFYPKKDELKVSGIVLGYPLLNSDKIFMLNRPDNLDGKLMKEFIFKTQNFTQKQKDQVNLIKHVTPVIQYQYLYVMVYIDNSIVFAGNTTRYVLALQEHIGNCEYYLFDHGGHEICFANGIYARNEEEIVLEIAICTNLAKK